MDYSWIHTTPTAILMAILSTIGIYITLILCTRFAGVRSFSKLSGFDFAITVAIGSLIASTVLADSPPLGLAIVVLATLYVVQILVGKLRRSSSFVRNIVDNKPILLMKGDVMLEANMAKAKVSKADIFAKLREANVLKFDQILAVIMETTGDISVLHHDKENIEFDLELLDNLADEFRAIDP